MKKIAFFVLLVGLISPVGAQKQISKNGHIWFYSHTPMEDVEAHNRQVASILDISTGDISFSLLMKAFEFKTALMQEHFNENYAESDKFPKATFKGKIINLDQITFKKDGIYDAEVSGDLTIHGVTKALKLKGKIEVKGEAISVRAKFAIIPKDFDIKIPSLVENKIAKEIETTVDVTYSPYK